MRSIDRNKIHIAVIIPAYQVANHIHQVITNIPYFIRSIIIVNDASKDETESIVLNMSNIDKRLIYLKHENNIGVGGAVCTGYIKALELGAEILVKMDGDGQMDPKYLKKLVTPLIKYKADYTKGNRFYNIHELRKMPLIRLLGNGVLGFMVRLSSGYWNIYDPTNGYTAIHSEVLKQILVEKLHKGFFFETNMLIDLYIIKAKVVDIPIPAIYGVEESSMDIWKIIKTFPLLLFIGFLKRILFRCLLYEFTPSGLFGVLGIIFFSFGFIFGSKKWLESICTGNYASAGTIMLASLPVMLGFFMIVIAVVLDISSVHNEPLINGIKERPENNE